MPGKIRKESASESVVASETWLFAQALLGKTVTSVSAAGSETRRQRELLEWLAKVSDRHADQLQREAVRQAEAQDRRELLEWAARISPRCADQLRQLQAAEAETREAQLRLRRHEDESLAQLSEWDPSQHPRGGNEKNTGQFSPGWGTGAATLDGLPADELGGGAIRLVSQPSSNFDPSRPYLPSDSRGTWVGDKGTGHFRLNTPVKVGTKTVREIQFVDGLPVLNKFKLQGKTATIILTGNAKVDIANAEAAWKKLNPGKLLPENATFHHDLLHTTVETIELDGKKIEVAIGKMHLVPTDINQAVFHQGSASAASRLYREQGIDASTIKKLAAKEASLAARGSQYVANVAKRIVPGAVDKCLRPYLGRIIRLIPFGMTGLAIAEFAKNAEAHGIGGAVARATPVLGDLIGAYDLGSELAKEITDEALARMAATYRAINTPVAEAWEKAGEQMIAAFEELALQIPVTNEYRPEGLVDPKEIADALIAYRTAMQQANYGKASRRYFNFDAAAARAKDELEKDLIKASQKNARRPMGSLL